MSHPTLRLSDGFPPKEHLRSEVKELQRLLARAGVSAYPRTAAELAAVLVSDATGADARDRVAGGTVESGTQTSAPHGASEETSCPTRS